MFNHKIHLSASGGAPVAERGSWCHPFAEGAQVMSHQGIKISPQLAASAQVFSVIITGKKDGQCRTDKKDLGGFDQPLVPVDAIGRYAISGI